MARRHDDWRLDPLPLVLQPAEWQHLEAGLRQRAELLDAILADLLGPRRLLLTGHLPAEIIASSPHLVRSALDIRLPGAHQLFTAATDVVRNADGAWTVLADHTDVPFGLGYAMEDRRIVAQVMAAEYRGLRVRRLAPFFSAMRSALLGLAPSSTPRLAVLAPGADAPRSFDHAELASMLGVPLVEARDLRVEDGRLWALTLAGRAPVDVLLRRVGARNIDPLEQPGASAAGVPGILHAAREGNLIVVNTFNSGLLSSPALAAFLPRLARHLLGEELALSSVATYWGGDRNMCSHVVANVSRLVLRPVRGGSPVDARALSLTQRAELCARISEEPWAWVGQEPLEPSEAETLTPDGVQALGAGLRTFTVSQGSSWLVMPGALVQTGEIQAARPRAAKDLWVMTAGKNAEEEAGPSGARTPSSVVSPRAAESLYRLGRNVERAEQHTRLVAAVAKRWEDFRDRPELLRELLQQRIGVGQLGAAVHGPEEGSIASCVGAAAAAARQVRDLIPAEAWPALAAMDRDLELVRGEPDGAPQLSGVLAALLTLAGIVNDSMIRDEGWQLLETGRRIERAAGVVATLSALHSRHPDGERLLLEVSLLEHDSLLPYRRRHPAGDVRALWQVLLTDPANPRAVAFQVERMEEALAALPARTPTSRALLQDLRDLIAEAPQVWDGPGTEGRDRVGEHLESMEWRLRALQDDVTDTWLATAGGPPPLAAGGQEE